MIRDLSQTLETILTQPGLPAELAAARIMFDRPIEQFNPQQTTIDLFLYDIRENLELRDNAPEITRTNGQATIRRPPLRVACTYLVTAWPIGGTETVLQEHRLLSQVLQVLSRYPTIPEPFLQGSLRGQEPPLPILISSADGLKNPAEFWTALNSPLRASLAITVTIAMETFAPETAPLAITSELRLNQESVFQIGGRVTDNRDNPVEGLTVMLVEPNLTTTTDAAGDYRLSLPQAGTYTLRVQQTDGTSRDFAVTVPAISGRNYNLQLT